MNHGAQIETNTAVEFLRQFFAGTKHDIELRALPNKQRIFTRSPAAIRDFLSTYRGDDLYFGVATREGGGKAANCRELTAFFCDVDSDEPEALNRIEAFTPEPSLMNFSGGGHHLYWLLSEPIDAHDPRVPPILRGVCAALGADFACAEIARVFRIPGTFNHKKKYDEPREVFTEGSPATSTGGGGGALASAG